MISCDQWQIDQVEITGIEPDGNCLWAGRHVSATRHARDTQATQVMPRIDRVAGYVQSKLYGCLRHNGPGRRDNLKSYDGICDRPVKLATSQIAQGCGAVHCRASALLVHKA